MDERTSWHPSKDEVEHIRAELRPLLALLSRRDEATLAGERDRRETAI